MLEHYIWNLFGFYYLINVICEYNDAVQLGGCICDGNVGTDGVIPYIKYSKIQYNSFAMSGGAAYFAGSGLIISQTEII